MSGFPCWREAVIVGDYDEAITFFVDKQFVLVEDSPAVTNDERPKRWVVFRPPDASTGLLLAQADAMRSDQWWSLSYRPATCT